MGHNWKTTKLLDHYDIRSGLSKPAKDFGSGYPFLTFKDVFYNYFTPDILGDLVQSNDKERASSSVKRGDVFLTRTSETMHELGMSCVALQDYENSTFNGFCKRLRPHKESELVPEYVGYYLRSPKFRQSMLAFSTMSTRASLNNEMIGRLEISYPSKNEQLKIAKILKTLDDKVALNLQINQTLEQMAQALFKSWFVDFDPVVDNALDEGFFEQELDLPDELLRRAEARKAVRTQAGFKPLHAATRQLFPAAFEPCSEPSLGLGGWVPKGWSVSTTGDELTVKGGSTPSTTNPEFWEGGDIHWTSPKDLSGNPDKVLLTTERKITSAGLDKITSGLLPPETVLMSSRAPVGYLAITKIPTAINQGYIAVTNTKHLSQEFVLYWLDSNIDMIKSLSGGTTFAEISKKTFRTIPIIVPTQKTIDWASNIIRSNLDKISANAEECRQLEKLRDYLVPKLISGELEVNS
ncbi:restriction endonuclease subunit S [Aeromonas veronii]|uniref:restriction endonuclease subunit S n=1 Tax=Aeromonas veronii TaxID=654 RepID=UPI00191E18CB|nr:restriction endonuclease subunit S [Aeromonas veronii]MBL0638337.1 restriction endonuclease subunit S [Aeromonas veronii]